MGGVCGRGVWGVCVDPRAALARYYILTLLKNDRRVGREGGGGLKVLCVCGYS